MTNNITIDDLLHGDQGTYGYLFPYRDNVPQIKKHIFSTMKDTTIPLDEFVIGKMLNINYIGWVAKTVLNLDLFPLQISILQTMWNKPFPMLIASRGAGKSFILAVYAVLKALLEPGSKIVIVGSGLRQARLVFNYIETVWENAPVLRNIVGTGKRDGPRQNVDLCYFRVGKSLVSALPLGDGCVSKSTLMLYKNGFGTISDDQPTTCSEKNIVFRDDYVWGNKKFRYTDESYCNGAARTKVIRTHHGFEFNATHNHRLRIVRGGKIIWSRMDTMKVGDRILLDRSVRWHDGDANITEDEAYAVGLLTGDGCLTDPYTTTFRTVDAKLAEYIQHIGEFVQAKSDPTKYIKRGKGFQTSLCQKFGISINHLRTKNKQFPSTILRSPRNVTSAFISGLFDTDGGVHVSTAKRGGTSIGITFYNTSKELIRQLQYILLHYGIVAHVSSRKRHENWEECYELSITGNDVFVFATEIGFRLKRKQDKLMDGIANKKRRMDQNDEVPHVLEDMIYTSSNNRARRGTGNTVPVCAGRLKMKKSASRPLVHNFLRVYDFVNDPRIDRIRNLADPDVYYDEIVSIQDDECVTFDVHVPDGHEYCANGFFSHNTKIRGFRATTVIADEFASIPVDVFDIVVRGFTATTRTPVEAAKQKALQKQFSKLDIPDDLKQQLLKDHTGMSGNQIIYSGTAYYAFNHFAKKYKMWEQIISSKGDKDKIAEIFGGEYFVPDGFDYRDYAVIRIPHNYLPEGLLDAKQLAHAKATLPKNIYLMEYGACLLPGSFVDTNNGVKKIEDVQIGDLVFTHRGRLKPVVSKKYRHYEGKICGFKAGLNLPILTTIDHPIYTNDKFISIKNLHLRHKCRLVNNQLLDKHIYDLTHYCNDYCLYTDQDDEFIYPKWGSAKEQEYTHTKWTKNNIPRYIPFDYKLGFIIGMYTSDGDINKKMSQVNITFNKKQIDYIDRFVGYVREVFNIECSITQRKYENVTRVHINSKIVCQFLCKLVGKYANQKRLICNNDITKDGGCGIIAGYWCADGHFGGNRNYHASSVSVSLVFDIKRLLNNLGCYAYVRYRQPKRAYFAKEKRYFNGSESWVVCVKGGYKNLFDKIVCNEKLNTVDHFDLDITDYHEQDYSGLVYNLEIEDDHSYLSHGIIHHNCFVSDSDGFFPRSLVEGCTVGPNKPISTPDGDVTFNPMMNGEPKKKYVVGIDPAAERDNLAVVVLEVWPNHTRVVYCWAVNKKEFNSRKKKGFIEEDDYYAYCCSKIRNIVKIFNPVRIEMDSQGGGYAVAEMLRNKKLLNKKDGEFPIYEIIDPDEPKPTDGETDGRHVLHLVRQSNDYNQQANISLHKSLETRSLLFPAFDSVKMCTALELEKRNNVLCDTYEDNVFNIEELKNELCTIQMRETSTGKEKFDTPQVVQPGSVEGRTRKGKLRKDRYTALLLGHKYVYDTSIQHDDSIDYNVVPGGVEKRYKKEKNEALYQGPGVGRLRNSGNCKNLDMFGATKRGSRFK